MATLESSIKLHDNMSRVLQNMINAMNRVVNGFNSMQVASTNCVDTSSMQKAENQIQSTTAAIQKMESAMNNAANANNNLNQSFTKGNSAMVNAQNSMVQVQQQNSNGIGNLTRQIFGLGAAMKAFQFAKESMDMSDVQRSSEIQLQTVLANTQSTTQQMEDAFDRLSKKASAIQGKGIYGDEAMIAGAAELATYFTDVKAIEMTMDTLSNFAMGMSGGGAVDPKQMVQYATQLGKAANGTFGGLSIKGFGFTKEQEDILKGDNDIKKAKVLQEVIGKSWGKLYEKMSNTPQGRIIQFNNALGDMREIIGNKLYGVWDKFLQNALTNLPQVQTVMDGIGNTLAFIASVLAKLGNIAITVGSAIINNWRWIAPIIGTATSALLFYRIATFDATVITKTLSDAWKSFNAVVIANPVIAGILAIVAALYLCVAAYNALTDSNVSATGIIAGSFMWLGALIGNIFIGIATAGVWVATKIHNGFVHFAQGWLEILATLQDGWSDYTTTMADAFVKAINIAINAWNGLVDLLPEKVKSTLDLKIGNVQSFGKIGSGGQATRDFASTFKTWNDPEWNFIDMKGAYQKGYDYGEKLTDFSMDPFKMEQLKAANKIAANTADTAGNTAKMKDSMDMQDTELKYLHDIAEREVINRFTTAEIKLDMTNNNNISSDVDIDFVITKLSDSITETMLVAAEGIHA